MPSTYYTSDQAAARFAKQAAQSVAPTQKVQAQANIAVQLGINVRHYLGAVNALTGSAVVQETGGTATCLDSIDPTNLPVGYAISFLDVYGLQKLNLVSGVVVGPPPAGTVLPFNYNSVTQPKYWIHS